MRSDEFGGAPVGRTFDIDAMGVEEFDFGIEIGQLRSIDGAVFEDPVMDEGAAFGDGGDNGEKWEIIDVETRERHRVDFVDGGDEGGFLDAKVDEAGAVVI